MVGRHEGNPIDTSSRTEAEVEEAREFDGRRGKAAQAAVCVLFGLAVFGILASAIFIRPEKRLLDFDQSFYLTIAHDLSRWGVFSNGIFDTVDSTVTRPPSGMFFVPVYPALVYLAMKADPRFERAVVCNVQANQKQRPMDECEFYARPIHLLHAGLLALAVVAIVLTAQAIFGGMAVPLLAGGLATAGLAVEADLFSFVMTESTGIALFSFAALAYVMALKSRTWHWSFAAGLLLGLLVLARPSFMVLAPVWVILLLAWRRYGPLRQSLAAPALALIAAFIVVLSPWITRNAAIIGKATLTEEYGSATLIERFAFNAMTGKEFALAFPYCLPAVGPALVNRLAGAGAMSRFEWDQPGSFFQVGRAQREALVKTHGKLDPQIGGLLREQLLNNGAGYVVSTIPMGWCGLWVFQLWGLLLLPLFAAALVSAIRRAPLFLLYAGPALVIVGAHAAAANHYPRYNLMLVGPISVGSAWIICRVAALVSSRRRRPEILT